MPVELRTIPLDGICIQCGELTAGGDFHGVHDVAGRAVVASDMGVTGAMAFTARVAGKGVDIMGAALLVIGMSGMMAFG